MQNLMKNGILMFVLFFSSFAFSTSKEIKITVNGMVCNFCAQGITKNFKGEPAVDTVEVKMKERWVKLKTKENQDIPDARIKELFSDAGYNVDKIERK